MNLRIWAFVLAILFVFQGSGAADTYTQDGPTDSQIQSGFDAPSEKIVELKTPLADTPTDAETGSSDIPQSDTTDGKAVQEEISSPDTTMSSMLSGGGGSPESPISESFLKSVQVSSAGNSGAAATSIPIEVPPGRRGMQPNISLNYSSGGQNGWLGVGWDLDMGAIQRSGKRGVDYSADDYVVTVNGSSSELVSIGNSYYSPKIEGSFSKYYKNPSTGGWEVTTKDGTKYYYGIDPYTLYEAKQDNSTGIFKWCLVRVQDTNGNYMTVTYWKDTSNGEIYLDRIDYTGNTAGLSPTNYVKFYRESRSDTPAMYSTNAPVTTAYRLKTISVHAKDDSGSFQLVRAYKLVFDADHNTAGNQYSDSTGRSLLGSVQLFGNDGTLQVDADGTISGGTYMPSIDSSYQTADKAFVDEAWGSRTAELATQPFERGFGDFNGDGRIDYAYREQGYNRFRVMVSTGDSFREEIWGDRPVNVATQPYEGGFGDFNGDGRTDYAYREQGYNRFHVMVSTGNGFVDELWGDRPVNVAAQPYEGGFGDFNGDGLTDYMYREQGYNRFHVMVSTGDGFVDEVWGDRPVSAGDEPFEGGFGDFNGDGRTDYTYREWGVNRFHVMMSTGNGFVDEIWGDRTVSAGDEPYEGGVGDFNGDGRADYAYREWGVNRFHVLVSTGDGFVDEVWGSRPVSAGNEPYEGGVGDFNGDGSADYVYREDGVDRFRVLVSTGESFVDEVWGNRAVSAATGPYEGGVGDFNGDGKADYVAREWGVNRFHVMVSQGLHPDLISTISNGIGADTTLEYLPSSSYDNCSDIEGTDTCLPFVVQTLSRVTTNDGNGNLSKTDYSYAYGYFDAQERENRGFEYTEATSLYNYDPGSGTCINHPDYDCTITETRFNQDDIFRGLPYYQVTNDSSGNNKYTETYSTYLHSTPYIGVNFPYLYQKDDYVYDGTATAKQATTSFAYDYYGNIKEKHFEGDVSVTDDQRYEFTEYYPDGEVGNYLVSLPKSICVSDVLITNCNDDNPDMKARVSYTYYSTTGNLWTKTAMLDTGPDPVITYAYNSYGNLESMTDAKQNPPATIIYDNVAQTYPWKVTNALGHIVEKNYNYKFGKVREEIDPDGNTTTYHYDAFGRIEKVINPYGTTSTYGTMTYFYPSFQDYGTIGVQKVTTYATEIRGTANYIWGEAYFDGLGRTIKTRSEGPDSKVVVTEAVYNDRGLVGQESLAYFETLETARYRTYQYDPLGRVIRADNPDETYAKTGYLKGRLTYIDPNSHQKVEEKDVYGRTIKIEEYEGTEATGFTLYATTTYQYDVLGNLEYVWDENNNETHMTYDTLSRKTAMTDPDMGQWEYSYDANGNLEYQKDAKDQEINFGYDALNRIILKDYPTGTDVVYTYDETFSTNSKGRLTTVADNSGTAKFYYDKLGRTTKTIKTVDSVNYTTETLYDALGRTDTITYPDSTVVKYEYDTGGNLLRVKDNSSGFTYAEYSGYKASGQIGRADYGNGVNTIYQYLSQNNRLFSITTNKQSTGLINLSYAYDNVGNITGITDYLVSSRTRAYGYDHLNRLITADSASYGGQLTWNYNEIGNMTYNSRYGVYQYNDSAHKHAVTNAGTDTYTYDANGNMTGGAGRTFTYDYDNRAESITKDGAATINVYGASGQRVKKITPAYTTVYIGKHYECTNGVCTKYIFAGSERIAQIEGTNTRYYHSDHLGSSSVITDQNGNNVQSIYYYPYGEIHTNTGSDVARHKFTGQEYDAETGLYYYNARYYDPKLARFITADTIVPEPSNPQALNRYSYCSNNPVNFIDPSGHSWKSIWKSIKKVLIVVVAVVAAVVTFATVAPAIYSYLAFGNFTTMASVASYSTHVALTAASYAAGGAAAGAVSSAIMGGDVGQGALTGAVGGAIAGFAGSATQGWGAGYQGMAQIGSGGVAGGIASEMTGGSFSDGFKTGAIAAAGTYALGRVNNYLETRGHAEGEAESVLKEHGINEVKQWPGQDNLTIKDTNVSSLREQLQVVRDKYKLSSFWSKANQVRVGRIDAKFWGNNTSVGIHADSIDIRVNPIGHMFCDGLQLCH